MAANAFRTLARSRCTTNRFQPNRSIPEDTIQDIISTSLTSPSAFNIQPTQVIIVRDPSIKKSLSTHAMLGPGNGYRVSDASLVAVFLSDLEINKRVSRIVSLERSSKTKHPEYLSQLPLTASFLVGEGGAMATFLKQRATEALSPLQPMPNVEGVRAWSYKNTSLMVQTYVLACTSYGLATSIMEGFDGRRVREILRVPERYGVPMMVATGYEYEGGDDDETKDDKPRSPRLDLKEVFFEDKFGREIPLNGSIAVEK